MKEKSIQKRLLTKKEACNYIGLGLSRGVKFLDQANAMIVVGNRHLYDKKKLDQFIDQEVARQNASNSEV